MDPDTSKKVNDLLGLMEGISSDIDITAELDKIISRIHELEEKLEGLTQRFEKVEKTNREKQDVIKTIRKELKNLFAV
jgi:iron-sulfur cluster repair protein YtfE (RIC family)